jgi:hypothetical protein
VARLLGIPNLIRATVAEPGMLAVGTPGTAPADGSVPAGPVPAGGSASAGEAGPCDAANLVIAAETGNLPVGADVLWTIRPDHITVLPGTAGRDAANDGTGGPETYPATVEDVADIGTLTTLTVRLGTGSDQAPELRVRTTAVVTLAPGDPCLVRLPPADITAWPAVSAKDEPARDRLAST